MLVVFFFFFKQKTAYEMRISDWSSDVCSSDLLVLAWSLATIGARGLLRVHWPLHLLRGALGVGLIAGFVYGLRTLPLSTAYAISFVAPLLVTALAVPILGDKVGPRRWAATFVGLAGVLVVLRPNGQNGRASCRARVCQSVSI